MTDKTLIAAIINSKRACVSSDCEPNVNKTLVEQFLKEDPIYTQLKPPLKQAAVRGIIRELEEWDRNVMLSDEDIDVRKSTFLKSTVDTFLSNMLDGQVANASFVANLTGEGVESTCLVAPTRDTSRGRQ